MLITENLEISIQLCETGFWAYINDGLNIYLPEEVPLCACGCDDCEETQ